MRGCAGLVRGENRRTPHSNSPMVAIALPTLCGVCGVDLLVRHKEGRDTAWAARSRSARALQLCGAHKAAHPAQPGARPHACPSHIRLRPRSLLHGSHSRLDSQSQGSEPGPRASCPPPRFQCSPARTQ